MRCGDFARCRQTHPHCSPICYPPRDMEIRRSGKSPGVRCCGQKRMGSRTDRLPASGAADWDYQGVCRERFCHEDGWSHSALCRTAYVRTCRTGQIVTVDASTNQRSVLGVSHGMRKPSKLLQRRRNVAASDVLCMSGHVRLGESSCGAAVPRWMPRILCAAADAT